ncbi:MAG: hypothetical protein AAFU50_11900, partial [Pseudomonadota bacterium]
MLDPDADPGDIPPPKKVSRPKARFPEAAAAPDYTRGVAQAAVAAVLNAPRVTRAATEPRQARAATLVGPAATDIDLEADYEEMMEPSQDDALAADDHDADYVGGDAEAASYDEAYDSVEHGHVFVDVDETDDDMRDETAVTTDDGHEVEAAEPEGVLGADMTRAADVFARPAAAIDAPSIVEGE